MRTKLTRRPRADTGAITAYFILLLLLMAVIAGLCTAVTNSIRMSNRRANVAQALHFAEGGAAVAAAELELAYTNRTGSFLSNLVNNAAGAYAPDATLTTGSWRVYKRSVGAPFSNQTVTAQIWLTNASQIKEATVVGVVNVGEVWQSATVHLAMAFQLAAAIISDNPGTTATGTTKAIAQQGNVVVTGLLGTTVVDGGTVPPILANGRANIGAGGTVLLNTNQIQMTNYATANEVPDYTAPGSSDQLFDFGRFLAVANKSGTHYTNVASFVTAAKNTVLEGVIAVDISKAELATEITTNHFPSGINIRGTLLFNFAPDVGPLDKIKNSAAVNINAANLATMNPANPATFTTGYPPTYTNPAKNPAAVDISSLGFPNFTPGDDLPALMYNQGFVDLHGPLNICGVVYSPSFIELDYQPVPVTQYIRGSIISGGGVFLDNKIAGNSIVVSFDNNTLDSLATSGSKGKGVKTLYWE